MLFTIVLSTKFVISSICNQAAIKKIAMEPDWSYTNNVIVHRGFLDDGVNFIPKPFSQKDLAFKVHTALGRDAGGG